MQVVFHIVLWECVICGGQIWEKVRYTLDDTMTGESHMMVRQFEGGIYPYKTPWNSTIRQVLIQFLVPLFWLQFSKILLWVKKII